MTTRSIDQAEPGRRPARSRDAEPIERVVGLNDASLAHDLLVLRASVAECLVRGQGNVTVDLSELTRLSSVSVAALLWARRSCGSRSVGFRVEHVRGSRNRQVLQRCGLYAAPAEGSGAW